MDLTSVANDDLFRRRIDAVERALGREDPAFVKRFRRLQRSEMLHDLTVFALLAVGAVVMTVGLATTAVFATSFGVAAMLAGLLVDVRHRRVERRWPRRAGSGTKRERHETRSGRRIP